MSENRKCFSLIWKIRNFKFSDGESKIRTASFFPSVNGVPLVLRLHLWPRSDIYPGNVACHLHRDFSFTGPFMRGIDYELSFITLAGSVLHSEKFSKRVIEPNNRDTKSALHVNRDVIYKLKKDIFAPDDILTIYCKIWDTDKSERFCTETVIKTECRSLVGTIENFCSLEPGEKHPVSIKPSETENFLSCLNLRLDTNGKLDIEIQPVDSAIFSEYECTLFILDVFGKKVRIGEGKFCDKILHCIPLTLLKEHLIGKKDNFLTNGVLTIECEIIFPSGEIIERLYSPGFVFGDNDAIGDDVFEAIETKPFSKENAESLTTLKDDLYTIFKQGLLCDIELKTATKTFQAHKNVLIARSPFFKSIFTTVIREENHCIDIDDLDADTVRRMLDFMYLDTLDKVEYKSAKSLYVAAEKYKIDSLRNKCSNFLIQNILLSNVSETLLFADRYQDEQLKHAVYDFLDQNASDVLFSKEWEDLEKNHAQLAIEARRTLRMKKQKC